MRSKKERTVYQINQLRSDRILYMVESVAISILALLVFIGAPSVFAKVINPYDPNSLKILQFVVGLPVVFWLYALVGNMVRTYQIRKLQDTLQGKKK